MNKNTAIGSTLILLLIICGLTWALLRDKDSPELAEAKQMQKQLFSEETRKSMSEEKWNEEVIKLKHKASNLSKEEQANLWQEYKEKAVQEKRKYYDKFFALKTKQERDAFLDEIIDIKETSVKTSVKISKKKVNVNKNSAKKKAAKAEDKRNGLRNYLDNTTAEDRAREMAFYEAISARKKERGL